MLASSSSCRPTPVAPVEVRSRRFRRVLYPASRSRRLPTTEPPDQALRWLLLLSALVFLQIYNEETNTCTGWAADTYTHTNTLQSLKSQYMIKMVPSGCYYFWSGIVSLNLNYFDMHASFVSKIPTWRRTLVFVQQTRSVCTPKCLENWLNCASAGRACCLSS